VTDIRNEFALCLRRGLCLTHCAPQFVLHLLTLIYVKSEAKNVRHVADVDNERNLGHERHLGNQRDWVTAGGQNETTVAIKGDN
jgi:hypothetical protein